ncbi:MAG: alpha-2-macroglobulin family protein [Alphaproteobacteria bacterium]|nr:alpha-2-macroglobulin family protein [Alphaproteobacteria bacterium]MDE2629883.1 alpha-2-macroglobulin family protein [Alphaproteobacteria bacterium]
MGKYRHWILIGGGVGLVVVVAVVVALYVLGGRGTGGGFFDRLAGGFTNVTSGLQPTAAEATAEFAFHRLDIDTSKPQAAACLVFTRDLDASGRTHYDDYFAIDPSVRVAVHIVGPRLCLSGLDFDKTYNVTLKAGFPSASGDKLIESETVPVELRDKPSIVQFNGGIILPRENAQGVPITTVNITKLRLKLIRVGDRLLSQIESGTVDETTLYSWDSQQIENNQGSLIWSGTMDVNNIKNDSVVTLIPIHDILKNRKPGAYVLIASDANKKGNGDSEDEDSSSGETAVQWVVDSDIALTTFNGAGGLTVFARSYASAKPLSGVRLSLVARDNNEVATAKTDSDGRVDFDPGLMRAKGGDEPVVVMAYGGDQDFSFTDLRRSSFDLTDRGVGGREVPGPTDAFLYTERGVYRPGETVHLTAMLRDRVGAAAVAPLTLVATRPDGQEVGRTTIPGAALVAGSTTWTLPLSSSAPHGRWQIAAFIDTSKDAVAIGRVQFDVQDFVPQKLKVALTVETKTVKPGGEIKVRADSRFLYGAPASGLSAEAEARISADPTPFDNYAGWQFGRVDDSFSDVDVQMTVPTTDAAGSTEATGTVGELTDTTLALKAMVKVSIHEPGGRVTAKTAEIPVRNHDVMIGIRPEFDGMSVGEGARAGFEAVALDADGKRTALSGVTVSWVREDTSYQWYQDNGGWKYKSVTRDRLITSSTMSLGTGAPAKLGQAMAWGTYRLTITDPKSGASSSYRYYSGWAASSAGDRPDRIPVAADRPAYRAGETAHVRIKPAADGKALVVVAGDKVFSSQVVDAPTGGATVDVSVSADWGAGAYVLVTDYRPLDKATGHEPVRSIGLVWLSLDNSPRTLSVLIGGPKKILPRQHLNIPVQVKGLSGGEDAYLTLAAVDEGILQLTEFKSPDPVSYYFGKRRLGVEMRDDYGRLIKAEKGAVGAMREGGDMFGGRSLAVVPTKTVALFSGIVKVGAGGMVSVPVDVPDFNGELRLMAVVFSADKLGHADRPLTVRDPVVADIVLPRFLAPNDRALAALNMNNVEGRPGTYTATIMAGGPVGLAGGAAQTVVTQNLNVGQRVLVPVEVDGKGLGIANIALKLVGPGGFSVTRSWPIQVRSPQLDIARDETVPFVAGASYTANKALVADLVAGTQTVGLTVSAAHGYSDVPGLLKWLDKYPYGCIEQTTSRAMPLLFFNDLADLAGLPRDKALRDREQQAVDSVLDMQNFAGNFGMWGPGSDAEPWISAFALDFLTQAKAKNYVVPNDAIRRGTAWLRRASVSTNYDDATRAYAFYLLARAGQVNVSDLRYFSDTRGPDWNTAIAGALTGAAAAEVGDRSRAAYGFNRAREIALRANAYSYPETDYGTLLRDLAGATALAAESGEAQLVPVFLSRSDKIDMRLNATTTQEKAWMLRAAYELTRQRTHLNVLVNGKPTQPRDGAIRLSPDYGQLNAGIVLANKGDATVWRTVSVQGTPAMPLPAAANGLTLTKSVWTMSGSPADLGNLHQNDRIIVELSGRMSNNYARQMGVIDLLPAGLEIEQTMSGDDGKPYNFLDQLTDTSMADKRDDRFVAAFTIGSAYRGDQDKKKAEPQPVFHVAYVARAVTEGTFVMPAGVAEDMYAPGVIARTTLGSVTVKQ